MRHTCAPVLLTLSLLLGGCGGPAPLTPAPEDAVARFGPTVQYHASRQNGNLLIDGIAQGVPSLQLQLVRGGRVVKTQPVPLENLRFAIEFGPVQDGDLVVLSGGTYRATMSLTFPGRVS